MLKILAVIGCILLCLVVLVLWVIIVPRAVFVEYTENAGVAVKVRIFLFKIKVYPLNLPFGKKDKDKPKKEKTAKGNGTCKNCFVGGKRCGQNTA